MNPTPFSNLTFVVSVLILGITACIRRMQNFITLPFVSFSKPRILLSVGIIGSIIGVLAIESIILLQRADGVSHATAFSINLLPLSTCVDKPLSSTNNLVIFRLDDVQSDWHADLSMRMMDDAFALDMPMVIGMIPKDIQNDITLIEYLRTHHCQIEIGVHGWDHAPLEEEDGILYGEFAFLAQDQAVHLLRKAKRVSHRYTGQKPISFIPPQNQVSEGTIQAAHRIGLPVVSANKKGFFDIDTALWNYDTHDLNSAEFITTQCEQAFAAGDPVCVIMLHPQDVIDATGMIDADAYLEYQKLLTYFSDARFTVTTFSALYHTITPAP